MNACVGVRRICILHSLQTHTKIKVFLKLILRFWSTFLHEQEKIMCVWEERSNYSELPLLCMFVLFTLRSLCKPHVHSKINVSAFTLRTVCKLSVVLCKNSLCVLRQIRCFCSKSNTSMLIKVSGQTHWVQKSETEIRNSKSYLNLERIMI